MLLGNIEDMKHYYGFHKNVDTIIDYLANHDLNTLEDGHHVINDEVFLNIFTYEIEEKQGTPTFEGHRDWGDVHLTIQGREKIGLADVRDMMITVPYDKEKDIQFGTTDLYTTYLLDPNHYALVMYEDMHAVKLFANDVHVRKAVFKFKL